MNEEFRKILAEIKANSAKLDSCKLHKFDRLERTPGKKFTCQNCDGEVNVTFVHAYIQGYKAAGGDPNDIMEGYDK